VAPLLGDRLYTRRGETLEKVVGEMLRARKATVAVAKSAPAAASANASPPWTAARTTSWAAFSLTPTA
jgi:hypothetical protein